MSRVGTQAGQCNERLIHEFFALLGLPFLLCGLLVIAEAQAAMQDGDFMRFCSEAPAEQVERELKNGANARAKSQDGWTPLMFAAAQNSDPDVIRALLRAGADVDGKNDAGRTPLIIASYQNTAKVVKALLKAGAAADSKGPDGMTALISAAAHNSDPDVVKALIKAQAQLDARADNGATALMYAAGANSPEVLAALIKAGAGIEAKDNDGLTPFLVAAAYNSNPELIRELAEAGADMRARSKDGATALMLAAGKNSSEVIDALIAAGAQVNETNNGISALFFAARANPDPLVLVKLLQSGADTRLQDENGWTPLMHAAKSNTREVLATLLDFDTGGDRKTSVNMQSKNGYTALMAAASSNTPDVIDELLAAGAEVSARNDEGFTPLMWAAQQNKNPQVLLTLIRGRRGKGGAEVDAQAANGVTALMLAVSENTAPVVETLLQKGADTRISTRNGENALSLALKRESGKLIELLLSYGAEVNEKTAGGLTPLMQAVEQSGDPTILGRLLAFGADINARDHKGCTALMHAVRSGKNNMLRELLAAGANPDIPDNDSYTPLMAAAANGKVTAARALIRAGADLDLKNKNEHTALMIAELNRATRMVAILNGTDTGGGEDEEESEAERAAERGQTPAQKSAEGEDAYLAAEDSGYGENAGLGYGGIQKEDAYPLSIRHHPRARKRPFFGLGSLILLVLICSLVAFFLYRWRKNRSGDDDDEEDEANTAGPAQAVYRPNMRRQPAFAAVPRQKTTPVAVSQTAGNGASTPQDLLSLCMDPDVRLVKIKQALAACQDINARGERGETALIRAAKYAKNPDIIELLIHHGADLHARDEQGKTALEYAAENTGEGEAYSQTFAPAATTPLVVAEEETAEGEAWARDEAAVAQLQSAETAAERDGAVSRRGRRDLLGLCRNPETSLEEIQQALQNGADVNAKGRDGASALICAARYMTNPDVIASLLAAGANSLARDNEGKTALMYAALGKKANIVAVLADAVADGNTPQSASADLLTLCRIPDVSLEAIRATLQQGANINTRSADGETPLICAAKYTANSALVAELIRAGADRRAKDNEGKSALVHAALGKKADIVAVLSRTVSHPEKTLVPSPDGSPQLLELCAHPDVSPEEIKKALLDGADINARGKDGETPLIRAARHANNPEVLAELIQAGADRRAKDNEGKSALVHARLRQMASIVAALSNTAPGFVPDEGAMTAAGDSGGQAQPKTEEQPGRLSEQTADEAPGPEELTADKGGDGGREEALTGASQSEPESGSGSLEEGTEHAADEVPECTAEGEQEEKECLITEAAAAEGGENISATTAAAPEDEADEQSASAEAAQDDGEKAARNEATSPASEESEDRQEQDASAYDLLTLCQQPDLSEENLRNALRNGADVKARNEKGETALIVLAMHSNNFALATLLIDAGLDVYAKDNMGKTALVHAAYCKHPGIMTAISQALVRLGKKERQAQTESGASCPSAAQESKPAEEEQEQVAEREQTPAQDQEREQASTPEREEEEALEQEEQASGQEEPDALPQEAECEQEEKETSVRRKKSLRRASRKMGGKTREQWSRSRMRGKGRAKK